MDELTSVYIQECREQLAEMEARLLRLEQMPDDTDNLNAIFRAAHTIKGGAGVIECAYIEHFTHRVENLLDALRNGETAVSGELANVLLACCDHMSSLVGVLAAQQSEPDAALSERGEALTEQLKQILGNADIPAGANLTVADDDASVESTGGGVVSNDSWHVSVRFGPNVMRGGTDPLSFIRFLGGLGEIIGIETIADALPDAAEMDPESCYLGFEIRLQTKAGKADIERVFDFVSDECDLRILPPQSKLDDYLRLIAELPEDTLRLGEILVRCGAMTQAEVDRGLQAQKSASQATPEEAPQLGEILVDSKVVHKEIIEAAVARQSQVIEKKAREAQLVRVHADKLDSLIDLIGELVIAGASANLLAARSRNSDLLEATSVLSRLVENIRDSALQLRMVQIGDTFNRFHRVVRDVAKDLGKEIELSISGADTELDKSVVEKIGDPLMHLVRNSLDHGIEAPAVREAAGKDPQGTLFLNAFHDAGNIVIEVGDDGAGLNRNKILAKAIERGLVDAEAHLSDREVFDLIFAPGLSTADQVTNLSGRGVGMDVVRRNLQALRGTINVDSQSGRGTRLTLRLPLTLAIIDGFLVVSGHRSYVIPLDAVVECIERPESEHERNYFNLRGQVLPAVCLRESFGLPGERPARESVVVVQYAGQRAGIVVDRLAGELQAVIKPLGAIFRHLQGIGGSTILGSGEVALILDIPALIKISGQAEQRLLARPEQRSA